MGLNVGVGFGYRFNDIFRMDTTLDRVFGSNFSNTQLVAPTGPCNGTGEYIDLVTSVVYMGPITISTTACAKTRRATTPGMRWAMPTQISALSTGSRHFWARALALRKSTGRKRPTQSPAFQSQAMCTGKPAARPEPSRSQLSNAVYTEPGVLNNGTNWKLAMALTAGVSYELSKGLHLDTSYKFTSIGGGVWHNTLWPNTGIQHRQRRISACIRSRWACVTKSGDLSAARLIQKAGLVPAIFFLLTTNVAPNKFLDCLRRVN